LNGWSCSYLISVIYFWGISTRKALVKQGNPLFSFNDSSIGKNCSSAKESNQLPDILAHDDLASIITSNCAVSLSPVCLTIADNAVSVWSHHFRMTFLRSPFDQGWLAIHKGSHKKVMLSSCLSFLISGFHTMGGEGAMSTYKVCIGPNLTCMNDLLNRMGQFDHVDYNGEQVSSIFYLIFRIKTLQESLFLLTFLTLMQTTVIE
jgi:hypothetical protein